MNERVKMIQKKNEEMK